MARDDSPASSTASSTAPASSTAAAAARRHDGQCAVKWDRNLKLKLAIMLKCTSVTDRRTDGPDWHHGEMYITSRAKNYAPRCPEPDVDGKTYHRQWRT